jgi:hypothetical protein
MRGKFPLFLHALLFAAPYLSGKNTTVQITIKVLLMDAKFISKQQYSSDLWPSKDKRKLYRVAQKKVYAFDFVQRKNYKCYIAEINVAVFIKV